MAVPGLSEAVTATLRERSREIADALSEHTALYYKLTREKRPKMFNGGRTIVEPIRYNENTNFEWYQGYDTLAISPLVALTAAEFDMKLCAAAVSISGQERLLNTGENMIFDQLEERIQAAEDTMINKLSEGQYADGTGSGGNELVGLQSLVADAGTGTVGGIDSSTYTWWQNQVYDFSSNSLTAGVTTIQRAMNTLYLNCSRNSDMPDLIVADNTYFNYYWESQQAHTRFQSAGRDGKAFKGSLVFMGADVVFDGGMNGNAPSSHMYFLNTNHLHWRPHRQRNLVPLDPDRYSTNQDAILKFIGWAGAMTCSNRMLQGVMVA